MSRFLYICLVVIFLCRCSGDGDVPRVAHSYFVCGESAVHDGHAVVELLFHDDADGAVDFRIAPPELIGRGGRIRCGVEEHAPVCPHIHPVRLLSGSATETQPARPLLMELEHSGDSLTLEIDYSFVCESDSALEWGHGSLRIPFLHDGRAMHHRLMVEDVPLLPLEELDGGKGKTQRLLLRLNRLLM